MQHHTAQPDGTVKSEPLAPEPPVPAWITHVTRATGLIGDARMLSRSAAVDRRAEGAIIAQLATAEATVALVERLGEVISALNDVSAEVRWARQEMPQR